MGGNLTLKSGDVHIIPASPAWEDSGWRLDSIEELRNVLAPLATKIAAESLAYAFADNDDTYVMFAAEWGPDHDGLLGKNPPDDALDLYLRMGAYSNENDNAPYYKFNLRDCLADTMEYCREDGSFAPGLTMISNALKQFAVEIDETIATYKD